MALENYLIFMVEIGHILLAIYYYVESLCPELLGIYFSLVFITCSLPRIICHVLFVYVSSEPFPASKRYIKTIWDIFLQIKYTSCVNN